MLEEFAKILNKSQEDLKKFWNNCLKIQKDFPVNLGKTARK